MFENFAYYYAILSILKIVKDSNNNNKTKKPKEERFIEAHVYITTIYTHVHMSSSLVFQSKELQSEPH